MGKGDFMSTSIEQQKNISIVFLISYIAGLIGWFWDWGEHMGILKLGLTYVPAHLVMNVSIVVMFATIILTSTFKKKVYWFSYTVIFVGALLFLIQPEVGVPILFITPFVFIWAYIQHNKFSLRTIFLLMGLGLVLVGVVTDWFWHRVHPDIDEAHNMLFVIGHQIQLAGWLVGVLGGLILILDHKKI
jgi:hypothetical protein